MYQQFYSIYWFKKKWKAITPPLLCGRQIAVKTEQNLPISNPKPDLHNINAPIKFGKNQLIFNQFIIQKPKYGWTEHQC